MEEGVEKPALVILDMVKGYGWEPGSHGYDMVGRVRALKDAAYANGITVIHCQSMRRPTDGLEANASRLYPDSGGTEVIPELRPVDKDILIYKRYLSGFAYNDMDYTLRTAGIDCVVLTGASTDNCVIWTASDAFQHRYKVVVARDCTMTHSAAKGVKYEEAACLIMGSVLRADIIPSSEVIEKYFKPYAAKLAAV